MHGINEAVLLAQKIIDKSRNREVVYMEQVGIFVAEYAEWIYRGSSVVILILLIYVLHRIKKTEQKNLFMNEEIEKRLQQIEKQYRQKEIEDTTESRTEYKTEVKTENKIANGVKKKDAESVTVIQDVIEEVFS